MKANHLEELKYEEMAQILGGTLPGAERTTEIIQEGKENKADCERAQWDTTKPDSLKENGTWGKDTIVWEPCS